MKKAILLLASFNAWSQQPPRRDITPGATLKVSISKLCVPGYSKEKRKEHRVSAKTKREVMLAYGLDPNTKGFVIDHLVSLELGGSNDGRNLQPQTVAEGHMKDRLENKLHRMVCAPEPLLTLAEAQRQLSDDWLDSYRYYFQTR